jgi:hypothetical protein
VFEVTVEGEQFHGEVGDPPDVYWEFRARPGPGDERLPIERFELSDGGFLVAYEYDASTETFRPLGAAPYYERELETQSIPGDHPVVVVAHRDGDGDHEFDGPETEPPYRVDGHVVREWITVGDGAEPFSPSSDVTFHPAKVTTATPTPTDTPDDSPTPTATATGTASPTGSPLTTTATASPTGTPAEGVSTELPGFGLTAGIVGLVVGLALLAGPSGRR